MIRYKTQSRAEQNIKLENRKTVLFFGTTKEDLRIYIPYEGYG